MGNSDDKKLSLVIGSKSHSLADKCISWGEDIYIGDYDLIIFDVTTLNKVKLKDILDKDKDYFSKIRDNVAEAQLNNYLQAICIMDGFKFYSENDSPDISEKISSSNYSWSPIIPIFEKVSGNIVFPEKDEKLKYLKLIKKQEYIYSAYKDNLPEWLENFVDGKNYFLKVDAIPLVKNKVKRAIALKLYWRINDNYGHGKIVPNTSMIFLPPLEDKKKGINLLLEEYSGKEEELPIWIESYYLPGEKNIFQKIEDSVNKIKDAQEEIFSENKKLQELQKYKKLLYLNGKKLEAIVEDSFVSFGIEIKSPQSSVIEDRYLEDENGIAIPIEIRGKDIKGLEEKDLNQLTGRLADKPSSEIYKTRGIFILNHFRLEDPNKREDPVHPNIISKAKSWNIGVVTTYDIYKIVEAKLKGEDISNIKSEILNTIGVFKFDYKEEKHTN